MKGKRKEKKSDALQTKTDWTPRLWVEAQCSICPTTYLRSHRTPITCFIHRREKRKRKERRAAKRKWKAWCPWTRANKGRSDHNAWPFGSICPTAQNSKLHTKIYLSHIKNIKRQGVGEQQKRKENPDDQTKTDWWWRSPKSMAQYASIAQTLCSHSCTLQCVLFPQQHHTLQCRAPQLYILNMNILYEQWIALPCKHGLICVNRLGVFLYYKIFAGKCRGVCICSVPFCV